MNLKPTIFIWVTPRTLKEIPTGVKPKLWYHTAPTNTSTEYVQIMIPFDFYVELLEERQKLEANTSDLPFN